MSPRNRSRPASKHVNAVRSSLDEIARAVDALRAGAFVRLVDRDGAQTTALALETADEETIRRLEATGDFLLVLTPARAQTLKIRLYTRDAIAVRLHPPLNIERLRAITDPTFDLAEPFKGPFETVRENLPKAYGASMKLAKLAGLLPAMLVGKDRTALSVTAKVSTETILDYDSLVVRSLSLVTRARVPLETAERSEVAAFRAGNGEPEHLAILIGDPQPDQPTLVRLHSECFTGDLLGSLKCDCGAQLRGAIDAIARAGGGILLYLAQEGRGIGLINKLRAYRLQDQGFDTMEANERLGFERDERLYGIAARMLTLLGYKCVRLMTNNPHKVDALRQAGIDVVERVPHAFPPNAHNRSYLNTKAEKAGHLL